MLSIYLFFYIKIQTDIIRILVFQTMKNERQHVADVHVGSMSSQFQSN